MENLSEVDDGGLGTACHGGRGPETRHNGVPSGAPHRSQIGCPGPLLIDIQGRSTVSVGGEAQIVGGCATACYAAMRMQMTRIVTHKHAFHNALRD